MVRFDDFFSSGYKNNDKDVFHYLDSIAGNDINQQKRGMSHRLVRALIEIYGVSKLRALSSN